MSELASIYTKKRKEFGKYCYFTAIPAVILDILPITDRQHEYIERNPISSCFDTSPQMSESEANTERIVTKTTGMSHVEGGWAKEVDPMEPSDTTRFRKKTEKDDDFKNALRVMAPIITRCLCQNNTINIYEEYFKTQKVNYSCEPPTAKGLAVFKDPMSSSDVKRTVSSISWHPEAGKLAVTYAILNFQDARVFAATRLPPQSYVWDISNPNSPELEIIPPSPLCCLKFNPKNAEILVGGSYNGLISVYDLRRVGTTGKDVSPIAVSVVENSHHDPVYDIYWINSKTASQCVSVSTDGRVLWWDTRKLDEPPTDSVLLCTDVKGGGAVLGGCALEYNAEAGPSKYLVGTEQGVVLLANLKNRKQNNGITVFDQGAGKHHGPIYAIQRNPANTKCFLTVGDWTAKVWMEDIKTPIMTTKYHAAFVTGGCWSPTRPGVFFVTRADGVVDIWDYHYRQTEVTYSHKVSSASLTSIAVQNSSLSQTGGKLVAIGDAYGTVTLLELCDSLSSPQPNERKAIDLMFEREIKQEKNLEVRERELRRLRTSGTLSTKEASIGSGTSTKLASVSVPATPMGSPPVVNPPVSSTDTPNNTNKLEPDDMESLLRKLDSDFLAMIKVAEDKESKNVVESEK